MLCVLPGSVHAQALGVGFLGLGLTLLPHFAGIVLNVPGVPGSIMSAGALPTFPPPGVYSFWYPVGPGCLNGVQEVNLTPLAVGTPVVMLQGVGAYTFPWGPAMHPGQKIIGKYLPTMVCIAPFVSWVYCGLSLCPVVTPLPFFFAPLIIYNGSTP
ncbi:MAG: hypothetical protein A2849_00530 [Candidatus Taylorbacteria bacterium RIFCSPHIGHO2_01_FULL_51_15]|uniref:Uncharacterized protein n=1 Tax=Candidatus Taylorbacteria bacterium RIFCSPHIGHO2_01_FULL_51_15 TaxID=1802304 RepID=A0A1G2MBI7_9BACT|nr:MAG: hypothetical protein A2849_00530 [Candidatus Taylorbacteria bacterium RIFCSPHIGHO2_01_FULL_51_15]